MEEGYSEMPIRPPMPSGLASSASLEYQFENPQIIQVLEKIFQGMVRVETADGFRWVQESSPMINKKGLSQIRAYLTSFLLGAKNFALTNIDEDYARQSTIDFGNALITDINDNWKKYEIRDEASASFITRILSDMIFTIKKKGTDANYFKFLTKTHSVSEIQHHQNMMTQQAVTPQKKGILSTLFGRR